MTNPRQPGTNQWPPQQYGGYSSTDLDDLAFDQDEIGVPRGSEETSSWYWRAPQTLAPEQPDSAGGASAAPDPDQTAWWTAPQQDAVHQAATQAWQPNPEPAAEEPADWQYQQQAAAPAYDEPAPQEQQPAYPPSVEQQTEQQHFAADYSAARDDSWSARPAVAYPASEGYSIADVADDAPATVGVNADQGPRRAKLMLRHIDPMSTLKFTLTLTVALFVVWMVAVGVLYGILSGMGVFDKINSTINDVNGSTGNTVTPVLVFGAAGVIGAVNIVLFTAFATVGSFIYNICADLVGGFELTLAERD